MVCGRLQTWGLIPLVVLLVLIVGGIVGFRVGIGILKGKVVEALGPDSEITEIRVGWFERGSGGAANQGAEGMAGGR
jgi:hypothetical protein